MYSHTTLRTGLPTYGSPSSDRGIDVNNHNDKYEAYVTGSIVVKFMLAGYGASDFLLIKAGHALYW